MLAPPLVGVLGAGPERGASAGVFGGGSFRGLSAGRLGGGSGLGLSDGGFSGTGRVRSSCARTIDEGAASAIKNRTAGNKLCLTTSDFTVPPA